MATKDPRVDAYIAKSADFAKPIMTHLRKLVHAHCPETVETMKWSMPFFEYGGGVFATWPRSNSIAHSVSGWAIC